MANITTQMIVELREKTGCGMMDCKKALAEAGGNMEEAITSLRKKGLAAVAKRAERTAAQGTIASYVHLGGKIAVLVEVNCETDFVAKNEEFQGFAKDVAMQIAAQAPQYLIREDVPEEILAKEKELLLDQVKQEGKPEAAMEKIIAGRLEKFYELNCLMDQPFIKETKIKIKDLLGNLSAKIGEKIVVSRFVRYQVGEKG
ncbi:translation elongation factor Ts [candidate division WOR-1 bacterium RIFOXYB2_FULL_37_13]|uniref:Elongation factor Ts n=1 Tax=candidate division WOR-1 bacterium RIFOXYB2_FULL_37_13 TaxID=1802579 RepID=A0A1F4SZ20_UNCSA|nr:MAG: translation elongation factor Ts [candidate division WOR-1 bacterium RIFOXYB2_FULL_37_13]